MKKLIIFFMLSVSCYSYSQINYLSSTDTLYTKVNWYLTEIKPTDAGVMFTSTWQELLDKKYAVKIKKNEVLYSIGLGHQIRKNYYEYPL